MYVYTLMYIYTRIYTIRYICNFVVLITSSKSSNVKYFGDVDIIDTLTLKNFEIRAEKRILAGNFNFSLFYFEEKLL